jgi:GNAT superfamily N-acetyltransferase
MMDHKNKMQIKPAFQVLEARLIDFYRIAFSDRLIYLSSYWRWLYRFEYFDRQIPLVVECEDRVIAHAGMIPFDILLNKKRKTAAWFVDFKVLDQYQRKGLGDLMAKKWVSLPDCCFTFCNEKSIGVFKKNGWQESFKAYRLISFVFIFNHPGFDKFLSRKVRNILNSILQPILFLIFRAQTSPKDQYKIEKLTEENLHLFSQMLNRKSQSQQIIAVRDDNYISWRIKQSPNLQYYHMYHADNFMAVLLIHNNHGKYIDVLWVSDPNDNKNILRLMVRLGLFGLKKDVAYIRILTFNTDIAKSIKRSMFSRIQRPRLAFYSKDESTYTEMKNTQFNFELIDSDFEHIS